MRQFLILCSSLLLLCSPVWGQSDGQFKKGSLTLHLGTLAIYNTFSVGYESPDLLEKVAKHGLVARMGLGGWQASLFRANTGFQSHLEVGYLRGSGKHHLELASGFVLHFDKGLKGQIITYIGTLYRPFVGYRYQDPEKRFSFRMGTGWREVLQLGLNYHL